jgi:hypothetical protein
LVARSLLFVSKRFSFVGGSTTLAISGLPHTLMQAEVHSDEDLLIAELARQVQGAADEAAARERFRREFDRLRCKLVMYPASGCRASDVFESTAQTARLLATRCLPLAIAIVMHLYPLCVLQCVPMPFMSPARFKRAMLLRAVRSRSLVLANAGSERSIAADQTLTARECADGIRIDGTYDYMSLSSVADIVLFKARVLDSDRMVLCAADLAADSVKIGSWKFNGNMRLSDTSSVTFTNHRVPQGRYLLVPDDANLRCISDYQRCWFHLFLAEMYLARVEHLHRVWSLPSTAEHVVSVHEVARLREYSLRLLDDFASDMKVAALLQTTSALKLRVSLLAQATSGVLRSRSEPTAAADAAELAYIKSQPTADDRILRSLMSG